MGRIILIFRDLLDSRVTVVSPLHLQTSEVNHLFRRESSFQAHVCTQQVVTRRDQMRSTYCKEVTICHMKLTEFWVFDFYQGNAPGSSPTGSTRNKQEVESKYALHHASSLRTILMVTRYLYPYIHVSFIYAPNAVSSKLTQAVRRGCPQGALRVPSG